MNFSNVTTTKIESYVCLLNKQYVTITTDNMWLKAYHLGLDGEDLIMMQFISAGAPCFIALIKVYIVTFCCLEIMTTHYWNGLWQEYLKEDFFDGKKTFML